MRLTRLPSVTRSLVAAAAMVALAVSAAAVWSSPAAAHGDEGEMTVIAADPGAAGMTVHLEIGLVYSNDGDLAEEASVSATLTGPNGEVVGPVPLAKLTGARYGGDVDVPSAGTWTAVITSTGPEAESEPQTIEVSDLAPATSPTTVEGNTPVVPSNDAAAPAEPADDGGDSFPWVLLVVVAVVLIAAAGGYVALRRRGAVN